MSGKNRIRTSKTPVQENGITPPLLQYYIVWNRAVNKIKSNVFYQNGTPKQQLLNIYWGIKILQIFSSVYKFTDQKEKYIRALHYKLNCVIYKNEPILAWLFEDHSNADTLVIIHGTLEPAPVV